MKKSYCVYIVVRKYKGTMPPHGITVPIFWLKKDAKEFCKKQTFCEVRKIFIDELKTLVFP